MCIADVYENIDSAQNVPLPKPPVVVRALLSFKQLLPLSSRHHQQQHEEYNFPSAFIFDRAK